MDIETYQAEFGIEDQLNIIAGENGFPCIQIDNEFATAEIYLHGGHVTRYQPHTQDHPVLWMSDIAQYTEGKAIRGGIPLIFPWFGAHPTDTSKPSHGVARRVGWSLFSTEAMADGSTRVLLLLQDSAETRAVWDVPFNALLTVVVGETLDVSLDFVHEADEPQQISTALHTYFSVGDVAETAVRGLSQRTFIDQLDGNRRKLQQGDVRFSAELDRIYIGSPETCEIIDPIWNRTITVAKEGSRSTVVWNPWIDKASRMGDFPDDGYKGMLCVETANTADDTRTIAPEDMHTIRTIISVA